MALRTGYGTGSYNVGKYGYPQVYEGASAVSVTSSITQADYERVRLSSADPSATASVSLSFNRVRIAGASDSSAVTMTSDGYLSITGAAAASCAASVAINYVRIRPFSASDTSNSDVGTFARYKWIEQINASETWTESDYRGD